MRFAVLLLMRWILVVVAMVVVCSALGQLIALIVVLLALRIPVVTTLVVMCDAALRDMDVLSEVTGTEGHSEHACVLTAMLLLVPRQDLSGLD